MLSVPRACEQLPSVSSSSLVVMVIQYSGELSLRWKPKPTLPNDVVRKRGTGGRVDEESDVLHECFDLMCVHV